MRIVSQDGRIDLPYEQLMVSTSITDRTRIVAFSVNVSEDTYWRLAKYSTEEKAVKAMEMLREAYVGMPIVMQNVDISDDVAKEFERLKKCGIMVQAENQPSKVEYANNAVFQFPQDNEIEV